MPIRPALTRWIARYGTAEVIGTVTALGGAWLMHSLTRNEVFTAYGGALGENLGYYGFIAGREVVAARRTAVATGETFGGRNVAVVGRELAIEFGPAELLDSTIVRPLMMAIGTRWFGGAAGIVVGKIAADLTFYLPVIITYEARRIRRASPRD